MTVKIVVAVTVAFLIIQVLAPPSSLLGQFLAMKLVSLLLGV